MFHSNGRVFAKANGGTCMCMQAQSAILRKDAVPLMVRWLDAGPEQEVATAAARALAKAAKGNKAVQQAICDAGAPLLPTASTAYYLLFVTASQWCPCQAKVSMAALCSLPKHPTSVMAHAMRILKWSSAFILGLGGAGSLAHEP